MQKSNDCKTYEHYVMEAVSGTHSQTDCVTYDGHGEIVKWQVYSSAVGDWLDIPLETIEKMNPSMFKRMCEKCKDLALDQYSSRISAHLDFLATCDRDDNYSEGA